jgi:thiamine-monophosphate kinase
VVLVAIYILRLLYSNIKYTIFILKTKLKVSQLNKEDYFISQIKSNSIIGDDGAVIGKYVYSMDAFFESVHFKREWMSLRHIAQKSMLVNISDAIAMNAVPKYALITLAVPKSYTKEQLKELSEGFLDVAKEYGIEIIGGDTIGNIKLDISITIVSKTLNPIYRKGLKENHLVAFTNSLGSVKKDLKKAFCGYNLPSSSKFITPKLNAKFFYEIAKYVSFGMDISDGLFFELSRVSKLNRVDYSFFKNYSKEIGCSGEEYELLFGFDPKYRTKIELVAKKHKVKLNIFAKAKRGKYKCRCKAHHF